MLVCATQDLRSWGERVSRLCFTVRAVTHIRQTKARRDRPTTSPLYKLSARIVPQPFLPKLSPIKAISRGRVCAAAHIIAICLDALVERNFHPGFYLAVGVEGPKGLFDVIGSLDTGCTQLDRYPS